jgi:hypothetical protein
MQLFLDLLHFLLVFIRAGVFLLEVVCNSDSEICLGHSNVAPAQEEDWEAKARAWAATKAAQEAHQQAQLQTQEQSSLVADQPYMDYSQQPPHPPPQLELQQQFSYQPSLQETGPSGYYGHDTPHNFGCTVSHSYHQEAPPQFQQETPSLFREEGPSSTTSFGPTAVPPTSATLPQSLAQVVSSSYSQDISSHHDQDSSSTGRLSVFLPSPCPWCWPRL